MGVFSALILIVFWLSFCGAFVHFCFSLSAHVIAWRECWLSTPVSCDHGIVRLDCLSIKIFSHFWGVCPLWFWSFFGFRPVVLLSTFAFLCPPTWSHDENFDYPHLYHVIMGSCTFIVLVLKYFLILWVLSAFILTIWGFRPVVLFVHFCLSLSAHVIAWREFWLSTPVSCDHGIVHLHCFSIKIFSHSLGFVRFHSDNLGLSSCGAFCPFLLVSVCPRDRTTRMLIVHTCIRWSWVRTPWLLEY